MLSGNLLEWITRFCCLQYQRQFTMGSPVSFPYSRLTSCTLVPSTNVFTREFTKLNQQRVHQIKGHYAKIQMLILNKIYSYHRTSHVRASNFYARHPKLAFFFSFFDSLVMLNMDQDASFHAPHPKLEFFFPFIHSVS